MVIVDTNIIIDHLRRPEKSASLLTTTIKTHTTELFALSLLTIQELFEGRSTRDEEKETHLLSIITSFTLLPYTFQIAEYAGKINRDLQNPIGIADAAIAATAITYQSPLFTLNQKDFQSIPRLQFFSL